MIRVAELLRNHRKAAKRVADLQLVTHPHATVELDRLLTDVPASVGDAYLRRRHDSLAADRVGFGVDRRAREARHRFRLFVFDHHVDHPMLQRLERADRNAELLAGFEIVERRAVREPDRTNRFRTDERSRIVYDRFDRR